MVAFGMVLLWVILGVGAVVVYIGIGVVIGVVGWKVWTKKQKSLFSLLLFPVSHVDGNLQDKRMTVPSGAMPFGLQKMTQVRPHELEVVRADYIREVAFVWPLKLIFNIIIWLWIAITGGIGFTIREMEQRLFSSRVRVADPPPSRRVRFEELLVERQRIDAELDQLESELSEEEGAKVYRLPGRRSK